MTVKETAVGGCVVVFDRSLAELAKGLAQLDEALLGKTRIDPHIRDVAFMINAVLKTGSFEGQVLTLPNEAGHPGHVYAEVHQGISAQFKSGGEYDLFGVLHTHNGTLPPGNLQATAELWDYFASIK